MPLADSRKRKRPPRARSIAATLSSARNGAGSDNWCTPPEILERVRRIGPIVLDPCTSKANPVDAMVFYTAREDGLAQPWVRDLAAQRDAACLSGVVFVNPPYSKAADWAAKVRREARWSDTSGIAATGPVVPRDLAFVSLVAARPDSRWFFSLCWESAQAVCFWRGRLRFVGAPSSAPFPSALIYHGRRPWEFEAAFADAGKVVRLG